MSGSKAPFARRGADAPKVSSFGGDPFPQSTEKKELPSIVCSVDALSVSFRFTEDTIFRARCIADLLTKITGEEWDFAAKPARYGCEGWTGTRGAKISWGTDRNPSCKGWIFLSLLGNSLEVLTPEQLGKIFDLVWELHGRFTRVDVCMTVENPGVTMEEVERCAYRRDYIGRARRIKPEKEFIHGIGKEGHTVYFGSRESETFTRVYDKGLEQHTHEPNQLLRFEIESKGEKAEKLGYQLMIHKAEDWPELVRGAVIAVVDFADCSKVDARHRNRAVRFQWWEAIVQGVAKLLTPVKKVTSLTRVKAWLEDTLSATFSMVYESMCPTDADSWIASMLNNGFIRMNQKHYAMLREHGS